METTNRVRDAQPGEYGRFFGVPATPLRMGSVVVTGTRHERRARIRPHTHSLPYLSFVLFGSYLERVGQHTVTCSAYTTRFHPAGEEHENEFGEAGGQLINIELSNDWEESIASLPDCGGLPLLSDSAIVSAGNARRPDRRRRLLRPHGRQHRAREAGGKTRQVSDECRETRATYASRAFVVGGGFGIRRRL